MLQEQYRMHPEISRFPSKRFYGNRLVDVQRSGEWLGGDGGRECSLMGCFLICFLDNH